MQPVRSLLGTERHLLISPDGPLNLIPFAALVDEQTQCLVERYTITYLTSGRDLLRLQVPRDSRSQPVIVAAPAFGEPALVAADPDAAPHPRQIDERTEGRAQVDYSQGLLRAAARVGDGVKADVDFGPTLMLNRNRCVTRN
jgi:CHAT domain-containing protein